MAYGVALGGRADRQPQGAAVFDWSNPIASGLVGDFLATNPKNASINNAFVSANSDGAAYRTDGSTNSPIIFPVAGAASVSDFTIMVVHVPTAASPIGNLAVKLANAGASVWIGDSSGTGAIQVNGVRVNSGFADIRYKRSVCIGVRSGGQIRAFTNGKTNGEIGTQTSLLNLSTIHLGSYESLGYQYASDYSFAVIWMRALSNAEIVSVSENPWQLFVDDTDGLYFFDVAAAASPILRPSADLVPGGWTATPSGVLYQAINETVANDTNYITSPDLTTPVVFALSASAPAGTFNVRVRAARSDAAGQLRVRFLDDANADVGGTAWQALTNTPTTYTLSATTSATATRARIEVQP